MLDSVVSIKAVGSVVLWAHLKPTVFKKGDVFLLTGVRGQQEMGEEKEASCLLSLPYLIFPSASFPSFRRPSMRLASSARTANSSTEQERREEMGWGGRRV